VQRDPGGATEAVADAVLDGHVGTQRRPVVDVGCLAVRAVSAAHVVVVAADDHRTLLQRTPFDASRRPVQARSTPAKRTRMRANAQRDGRPAEYRWRPLLNATKFG